MSDSESQDVEKSLKRTRKVVKNPPAPPPPDEKTKITSRKKSPKTETLLSPDSIVESKTKKTPRKTVKTLEETSSEATKEKPKRIARKKTTDDFSPEPPLPETKKTPKKSTTGVSSEELSSSMQEETQKEAPIKRKIIRKKPLPKEDTESALVSSQEVNPSENTENSGKTIRRMTIKRISVRPGNNQPGDESATKVIERVSSLTDDSPVDVLPTQNTSVPENKFNKRDKNNGRNNKNFQNNKNGRYNNKNNRFNKNNNNRFNKQRENNHEPLVETGELFETAGMIEFAPKGYGFLRTQDNDFDQTVGGVYVAPEIIKRHSLRHCQWIHGKAINTNRGVQLREIISINGLAPEEAKLMPHFEDLKAINPNKRISLETTPERYTTRVLDMMAPIGRGQRGLIVAPPRTGKTVLLQHMAEAIVEKYSEEIHLMILLIDERPEEVTEFKRGIKGAEVFASSNDGRVREHCRLAELCIERAKRLVESGKHVFILMDSITRLSRAYNNASAGNGRTMSGGIDAKALEMPRQLFAAARNTREAGSLTIIATALIETNSRMDDLIFQEFKGTGNMELVLNRRIAEQYIYPAVDILKSGTRREELILPELVLDRVNLIRRALASHRPVEAMERLLFFLKKYPNNAQMLIDLKQRA